MNSHNWKQVKIQHVFDHTLDTRPELKLLVVRAAEFLDQEADNEYDTYVVWSLGSKGKIDFGQGVDRDQMQDVGTWGSIYAKVTDQELGAGHGQYFTPKDLDENHYRQSLLRMWSYYLQARTEKLHRLVFDSESEQESP